MKFKNTSVKAAYDKEDKRDRYKKLQVANDVLVYTFHKLSFFALKYFLH